jgi:hypothetical protein
MKSPRIVGEGLQRWLEGQSGGYCITLLRAMMPRI